MSVAAADAPTATSLDTFLDLIKPRVSREQVIFATVAGSHMHGLALPTSDTDFIGVYSAPTIDLFRLTAPQESIVNQTSKPDYQLYELHKFCKMLVKGSPNIVELLFIDRNYVASPTWLRLVSFKDMFVSNTCIGQYLGYARSQLGRLEAGESLHTTGGRFNYKWAYHAIRLLLSAKHIVDFGQPKVWFEPATADYRLLMDIRIGRYSQDDVLNTGKTLLAYIADKKLPDLSKTVVATLDDFLIDVRKSALER